jgi:hypothetical protein
MKTTDMIEELTQVAAHLGLRVRTERGRFRGGACRVEGEASVVLNRMHPPEVNLAVLAASLRPLGLEDVYLRPATRRALQAEWDRLDALEARTAEAPS